MRVERANSLAKKSNSLREMLPHIISLLLRSRYLSTAAKILNSLGERDSAFLKSGDANASGINSGDNPMYIHQERIMRSCIHM